MNFIGTGLARITNRMMEYHFTCIEITSDTTQVGPIKG